MNLKLPKHLLTIALSIMAMFIWGYNSYKFFIGMQSSNSFNRFKPYKKINDLRSKLISNHRKEKWIYEARYKDPFDHWLIQQKNSNKKVAYTQGLSSRVRGTNKPIPPPKLRLAGIIRDRNGALAVIEDGQLNIFFVRKGDTIAGAKILAMDSSGIKYEFNQQRFTLKLK